jgi:hypothetical protein
MPAREQPLNRVLVTGVNQLWDLRAPITALATNQHETITVPPGR